MAFSTEGAIAGGMQGFAAGGPIGGLIGAGIGGVLGGKGKSKGKKMRRLQRQYMAQAIKAIKMQNEISAQQWDFYQGNVQPLEETIGADLSAGRVGGAPEALQEQYRSKASGDVMQSFARQRQITKRSQAAYGIDPTSGAAMSQEQKQATAAGLGEAGAMTRAGERAGEDYRGERDRFINRWSNVPGQASQQAGEAGQGFASAADYQGGLIDQNRARTSGQMEAFMPLAKMGSDAYANRGGGGGAEANPTYNNPSFAEGGPAVGEAIAGGYDMASAEGGSINGPGGPIDDQVPAELPKGSYVIPADVVSALGVEFFDKIETQYASQDDNAEGGGFQAGMQQRVNAMTSDGEYVISPAVVKRKGKKFFDDLLEKYHKPAVDQSKQYQSKTADATDGSQHKFITAANGYKGQQNTTAPAGPTSRHYSHGGQVPVKAAGGPTSSYYDGGDVGRRGGKSLKDGGVSNTGSKDGEKIKPKKMARRARLRHGQRQDGGYTGGKDLYQGTFKEGGYAASRTTLGDSEKPLGMHGKDGGPAKKTRRGGKKHKKPAGTIKYQDGGPKVEVKVRVKNGGKYADGGKPKSDWQLFMGDKPRPAGKNIRGNYTGTGIKKPKTGPVKRRVYASEPGAKKYGEE